MKNQSNQVKERPIIFSGEMVKAILDGKKTMTRRVVKSNFINHYKHAHIIRQSTDKKREGKAYFYDTPVGSMVLSSQLVNNPYGKVGDRLWVRETYQEIGADCLLTYRATYPSDLYAKRPELENVPPIEALKDKGYLWKSPLFMPREFSRLLLEITDIRVEHLQDISEADAMKEGVKSWKVNCSHNGLKTVYKDYSDIHNDVITYNNPIASFKTLWDTLNAKKGYPWSSNPWVWVVEFKVVGVA